MQPGEVACIIILWALCSMFPHNSTHISCISNAAPWPFSPFWTPCLSDLNDAGGHGAQESPIYFLPEHVTAQKALYRKEPLNNTFLGCSLQRSVGASWVWHNTMAGMAETEVPGKTRCLRSNNVSPVWRLLTCSSCMYWLQNFGISSFKSYFHCSLTPPEILMTESALSPFF